MRAESGTQKFPLLAAAHRRQGRRGRALLTIGGVVGASVAAVRSARLVWQKSCRRQCCFFHTVSACPSPGAGLSVRTMRDEEDSVGLVDTDSTTAFREAPRTLYSKIVYGMVVSFAVLGIVIVVSLVLVIYVTEDAPSSSSNDNEPAGLPDTNVIMMISDGYGPAAETFGRLMTGNKGLELDSWLIGRSRTYSASSDITDSAAGATAYSCAMKTYNSAIAVKDTNPVTACGTVMEAAKREGFLTAVVVTSRLTHATPASYISHMSNREYEEEIATQIARNQTVDILFGGGRKEFSPEYGRNIDDSDLFEHMEANGYQLIKTRKELLEDELEMPIIGCFADSHMDYEIDRLREDPIVQPSLPEMVEKALELIKQDGRRFFMLIEGSRIDMAAHDHDAGAQHLEISNYQEVAKIVKKWVAEEMPNTMVVSTSDHSTGGISVGASMMPLVYPNYTWSPDVLRQATGSMEKISQEVTGPDAFLTEYRDVQPLFTQFTNIEPTEQELTWIMQGYNSSDSRFFKVRMGDIVAHRAGIGFTTPGHTGVDVSLFAAGRIPNSLGGVMENTDIGKVIVDELGLAGIMDDITEELKYVAVELAGAIAGDSDDDDGRNLPSQEPAIR